MFKRLILDDAMAMFTFIAFLVTASIFLAFLWRALRMKREQVDHFAKLPLESENHSSSHDA